MAITMFVSLYTTRLLLNSLGVSDFGIYNIVGGAIAMLGFLNSAMASSTQRFMSYAEGEGNVEKKISIFNASLILHGAISLVVVFILIIAALFFFNGILNIDENRMFAAEVVYGCLIVSTLLTVMNVPYDAVMNAHENMLYYSIIGIVESILKLLVAFACVYTTYDKLIVYGILMACIPALTLTIMKIYCHHYYSECCISPLKYYDRQIMRDMTRFAGWSSVSSFSALISGHGSNIVLNHFYGTSLNAANGVTGQLNGQLQVFGNTMLKALNPVLVKSEGEHDRTKMFKYAFTGAKLSVCMFALFAIPIIIDRDYVLDIWLKNVPPYTSVFIKYLIIWTFFSQIAGTLGTAISAIGKIKSYSLWNSLALLSNIVLLYVAFSFGANPEIFMILSCTTGAFQTINTIYYSKKLGGMSIREYMLDVFGRVVLGIFVTYLLAYWVWNIMDIGIIRFAFTCFISVVIYIASFYCFTLNTDERTIMRNFVGVLMNKCNIRLL